MSSASLSSSAGSWKLCEYANLTRIASSSYIVDPAGTINTQSFNPTAGRSLQGVVGGFMPWDGTSATMTVKLQESIAGVWTDKATATLVHTSVPTRGFTYYYMPFGTPYTATSNAFRLNITCTAGGEFYWYNNGTGGSYVFAIVGNGDDSSAPATGDTLIQSNNTTLTMDASFTYGANALGVSHCLCYGATYSVPNPGSAITIDLSTGTFSGGYNNNYLFGTSGTPIAAGRLHLKTTISANGYDEMLFPDRSYTSPLAKLEMYGAPGSDMWAQTGASASSGQAKVTLAAAVPASWTNGDTVYIVGRDVGAEGTTTYTMTKTGANEITLSANLDFTVFKGGAIFNYTQARRSCGIWVEGAAHGSFCPTVTGYGPIGNYAATMDHFIIQGSVWDNFAIFIQESQYGSGLNSSITDTVFVSTVGYAGIVCAPRGNFTMSNAGWVMNNGSTSDGLQIYAANSSFTNMLLALGGVGNLKVEGNNISGANWIVNTPYYVPLTLSGNNINIDSLTVLGQAASLIGFINLTNFTQENLTSGGGYGLILNDCSGSISVGSISALNHNASGDVDAVSSKFMQYNLDNCVCGNGTVTNIGNATPGSYVKFHNYNTTIGDHRTWKRLGKFTTPSPYTALVEEVSQATTQLSHQFQLLSQVVASKQHYLVLTGQIGNAAYYGGTHTDPTVKIYTDGNSATPNATLVFSDSDTSAHTKSIAFTPSTSYNQVILDFLTKTDATGTNADVTWSACKIVQRIYGQAYTSQTLGITETLTYPIGTLATPASNPFITQGTQATVHAYTGIAFSSNTLTISSNHTRQEIYDWVQDYLSLNPTVDDFFSTTDGVNYTATCNITINTGIGVTGGGSINIGANTWTNNGTYDGIVITASNRIVHVKLAGVVSGSQYYLKKVSDNSQVFNATATGSTDDLFTYTTDTAVTGFVRKAGYVEAAISGTITSTGLTLNVAQTADPTF